MLWIGLAFAAEGDTIQRCTDKLAAGDVTAALSRSVRIETKDGTGTGVVISPDGVIVTAAHVVASSAEVEVVYANERKVAGRVVRRADGVDLALVRVDDRSTACLVTRADAAPVGSEVLAIGNPGGKALSQTVSKGIVSAYRDVDGIRILQTDTSVNAGNSGGPLVDKNNALVGVVSFKLVGQGVEGLGFALTAADLEPALGFKWSSTTSGLEDTVAPSALLDLQVRYVPEVEPGDGVVIDTTARYTQRYRPKLPGLIAGSLGLVAGAVIVASTNATYEEAHAMPTEEWQDLQSLNAGGWAALIVGSGIASVSLIPSDKGAIVVEAK